MILVVSLFERFEGVFLVSMSLPSPDVGSTLWRAQLRPLATTTLAQGSILGIRRR